MSVVSGILDVVVVVLLCRPCDATAFVSFLSDSSPGVAGNVVLAEDVPWWKDVAEDFPHDITAVVSVEMLDLL